MIVSGSTRMTCIIGDPVAHSLSPLMQNAAFSAAGLDIVYLAFRVSAPDLPAALAGLRAVGVLGFNVTMPHKEAVAGMMDQLGPEAELVGAVNTVLNDNGVLIGHNTDGLGFVASLVGDLGFSPRGKQAVIFGAGGAARAIAAALAQEEIKTLTIVNRSKNKADILVDFLKKRFASLRAASFGTGENYQEAVAAADLVVNATAVGMGGSEETPFDPRLVSERHVVYDIVYDPEETALLAAARAAGARTVSGKRMLLYQGMAAFHIWTGVAASKEAMERALYPR